MMARNKPLGLLAELTYRCPLHCPYCSNPLNLGTDREELTLAEWERVLAEARDLGVLQLHLSGGEPLQRRDLVEIVVRARELGFYSNLITSPQQLRQQVLSDGDHLSAKKWRGCDTYGNEGRISSLLHAGV